MPVTLFSELFAVANGTAVGALDINPADAVLDWKTYTAANNKPYNSAGAASSTCLKVNSGIVAADAAVGGSNVAAAILTSAVVIGTSYSISADFSGMGIIGGGVQNAAFLYARVKKSTNEDTGLFFRVCSDQALWDDGTASGNTALALSAGTHSVKITCLGNVFAFFVDGVQVLTRTMTANASEVGIGFGVGKNNVTADNFLVTRPAATPGTPTGVTPVLAGSSVGLTWTAGAGDPATTYHVFRSSGGAYAEIGTSATAAYTDSTATAGSTVTYKITAENEGGTSAQSSASSSVNIPAPGGTGLTLTMKIKGKEF